jgi:hypothetical protein
VVIWPLKPVIRKQLLASVGEIPTAGKLTCRFPKGSRSSFLLETKMAVLWKEKKDVLQGTLALMFVHADHEKPQGQL